VVVGASDFGVRSCECGIGVGSARAELINAVPNCLGGAATPPHRVFAAAREQEPGAGQVIVGPAAFHGHLLAHGRHFVCKMLMLKLLRISHKQIR
jgi:hypothetical protein